MKGLLGMMMRLQNADGSFPRKFRGDLTVVDGSGGSTPSATLPLTMAYSYFNDKKYLESARATAKYLEPDISRRPSTPTARTRKHRSTPRLQCIISLM